MATRNKKRRHLSVASNDGTSPKKTKTAMMTSLECPGNFFYKTFSKFCAKRLNKVFSKQFTSMILSNGFPKDSRGVFSTGAMGTRNFEK